jgi:hypothetical protein
MLSIVAVRAPSLSAAMRTIRNSLPRGRYRQSPRAPGSHFSRVVSVVLTDAKYPPHRKSRVRMGNGDCRDLKVWNIAHGEFDYAEQERRYATNPLCDLH